MNRRKLSRVLSAVAHHRGDVGPLAGRGWRSLVARAVALAPELPPRAWRGAVRICTDPALRIPPSPRALALAAAVYVRHARGPHRGAARRRAEVILDRHTFAGCA